MRSLLSASLLVLAACDAGTTTPPCTVVDNGDAIVADDDRFVVYGISDTAGGLTCVPGLDVDGDTCADIFLGCVATSEGPLNSETTFTIGIENRAVDGDDLVITELSLAGDPSWSIPVDVSPNVQPLTSLEVTIAFTPTIAGEVTGALRIETNASNGIGTDVIQLRGTGTAP